MTMEEIDNIRSLIRRGIQLSGQMSYSRRAANERAIPLLQQALSRLKAIVENGQADYEVFRLLALTHENLLDYREAIKAVQECINRSAGPKKDDLKRLARYKEQLSFWEVVSLTPGELNELGVFLHDKLFSVPAAYEHSFRWTIAWLSERKHPAPDKVISGLERLGAFDDFQVLHNVIVG
jgi:tetratricopeptide (TPR) repeat protein